LAVNPSNTNQIVGTAFTPDPLGGSLAPIFVSEDGGTAWQLNSIVPSEVQTGDIYVGFGQSGELYAGILRFPSPPNKTRLNILRAKRPTATNPMEVLVDRLGADQPFLQTFKPSKGTAANDRVYVGNNDFAAPTSTSFIDFSLNAKAAKAVFKNRRVDSRSNT